MATPKQLSELIASLFHKDPNSVRQQARVLRDTGLMAKEAAGRGRGTMSALDAVNLLVAVAASPNVKDSALTVSRFESQRNEVLSYLSGETTQEDFVFESTAGDLTETFRFTRRTIAAVAELLRG